MDCNSSFLIVFGKWNSICSVLPVAISAAQVMRPGGVYCENCDIAPVKTEGDDGVRPYAIDPANAQRLWAWSERWL